MNVSIVYDQERRTADGQYWRVATFVSPARAIELASTCSTYFVETGRATRADLSLARDRGEVR